MYKKKIAHKPFTLTILASYLLSCGSLVLAADPARPDAGTILRDSQQKELKLPQREMPNLTVTPSVKPPMVKDSSFKVFVKNYRISGQDIIENNELTKALEPYTNKEMSMNALQEAASEVAQYLQKKGYFVAQAYLPAQEIHDGTVEIAVIVGKCGDIILKNQSAAPDWVILQQLAVLKPGVYIQNSVIERAALLASDLSGVSAKFTLAPGKLPGTTDIIVEAKNKGEAWQGSMSVNNQGSRLTGYNQTTLNFMINNPLKRGDSVNVAATNTFAGQWSGNVYYHVPLAEGSLLNLGYSKTYYELGKDMAYLKAYGAAYTKHADVTYSLRRSRSNNLSLQLGYDYKTMADRMDYSPSPSNTDKKSHMLSFGVLGDSNDSLGGGGMNSYSLLYYTGSMSGGTNDLGTKLATGSWNKVTYSMMRQQYLKDRLSLLLSLSGQMASTNLDSSERFSLGGANGVRAYPSSEAAGDQGWLATAEFRYNMPISNGSLWQLTAFYDAGGSELEKNPTQHTSPNHRLISGAGLGLNYIIPGNYSIKAAYAWRTGSEAPQADTTFGRGHFWLSGAKYF